MSEQRHLFFLIHGFLGSKNNMRSMHLEFERTLPAETCTVYSSQCSQWLGTFDGIEIGAARIFQEVLNIAASNKYTHISIIGYSMGGLYARVLVGMLQECGFFERVKPVNLITVATPHLGTSLWKQTIGTRINNGIARLLLGPSGFDLMTRGPHALLDRTTEPDSSYMLGAARFPNLVLLCNAVGDRTVKFWTSFLTDKHPFPRGHHKGSLAFFDFNKNPHGPFLVDLNNSKPSVPEPTKAKKKAVYGIAYSVLVVGLLAISLYSWIKYPFLKLYWSFKANELSRTFTNKTEELGARHDILASERPDVDPTSLAELEERIHLATEELPSEDGPDSQMPSSDDEDDKDGKYDKADQYEITSSPRPFDETKSNIITGTTRTLPFTESINLRMHRLNQLPWKKYVVYLTHYRTHAFIIDRLNEGDSQGTESLRFLASQLQV